MIVQIFLASAAELTIIARIALVFVNVNVRFQH